MIETKFNYILLKIKIPLPQGMLQLIDLVINFTEKIKVIVVFEPQQLLHVDSIAVFAIQECSLEFNFSAFPLSHYD